MNLPLIPASQLRAVFTQAMPLLDLRAPVEFARGAFPRAVNRPLMSDDERAAVGTCYKQHGQAAAITLGHQLVAGAVREERMRGWQDFARQHPEGALYCFRGGLRSQTVQQWLADVGVVLPRVEGGYKALRQCLLHVLETRPAALSWVVIAGRTGSGKTHLLTSLPQHLDLEGRARHRGSAFGRLLEPQPTQIDFENAVAVDLLHLRAESGPVFVEDESHLIGRSAVPAALRAAMDAAPRVELDLPLEARVDGILDDYIHDLGRRFAARDGELGSQRHRERLLGDLARIQRRLGGVRYQSLRTQMEDAFAVQQRTGAVDGHRQWIRALLTEYYDPMYDHQRAQRPAPLLQADAEGLRQWAAVQRAEAC